MLSSRKASRCPWIARKSLTTLRPTISVYCSEICLFGALMPVCMACWQLPVSELVHGCGTLTHADSESDRSAAVFSLFPIKEIDQLTVRCMDCLTSLRAIVQHPESPPDPADHIGAAIVARVLDDATAPLSVTAAACASLICHPARSPAVCSSQMARAVRAIVSCDEADSPLTQDSHFFEPHFRCVVLQLLGVAAPMIAQHLVDDMSASHSLSD